MHKQVTSFVSKQYYQESYDGGFENYFGNTFCCSECIENQTKQILPYNHKLFDSETSENEELDDEVVVVDDNVIEGNDDDSANIRMKEAF